MGKLQLKEKPEENGKHPCAAELGQEPVSIKQGNPSMYILALFIAGTTANAKDSAPAKSEGEKAADDDEIGMR